MTDRRRMTIIPPLTEAEFVRFCAANPELEIDRDRSGVIVMSRKRKCRDDYGDWLLSQRGTISSDTDLDDDSPRIGAEIHRTSQDTQNLQALEALRDRLIRERESSEGARAAALNVAISALVSAIDILESLIAHEQGKPQKVTGRDMGTNDQRREYLTETAEDNNQSAVPLTAPFLALPARDISDYPETITAVEPEQIERVNRLVEGVVVDPDESQGNGAWTKNEQSGEMFWIGSIGSARVRIVDGLNGLWLQVDQTEPISVFDRLTEGYDWPKIEGLDDFELGPVRVVSVRLRELFRPFVIYLSKRDFAFVLKLLENPPAPNEKLKEAMRRYQSAIADSQTSDTKSISEIVDTE